MREATDTAGCPRVSELIEPYLDGELEAADDARVASHLAGCAGCAAELELAARIRAELRALPAVDAPWSLIAVAAERAPGSAETGSFSARRWRTPRRPLRLALAAAAVLAALVVGGRWLGPAPAPVEQPSAAEVARAAAEARYALAQVGRAGRLAARELKSEVLERRLLVPAAEGVVRSLNRHRQVPVAGPRSAAERS